MSTQGQTECDCKNYANIFVAITKGILMFCLSILVLVTTFSKPSDSNTSAALALSRIGLEFAAMSTLQKTDNMSLSSQKNTDASNQLIIEQRKQLQEINLHLQQIDKQLQAFAVKHKS